ncbi:MAG: NAD(P)/FAD-dependent oxidoreductase [Armatimonadetes bacterium]|nr:NAD(P)/FAD-dependent oxidoreductase [Armatimonadota bacterium]
MGSVDRVDLTIIGGGPVGLFGAFYAGLRGMSVRVIDSLPELGGQLTALYPEKYVYDMPGFPEVLAKDLAAQLIEQARRFQPELVLGQVASGLEKDGDGWTVTTGDGRRWPTGTVLITAGAGAFAPTKIGVKREDEFEGNGLTYGVRDKAAFQGKKILVVGGGDSAFDWAVALHPIAAKTTLVHRNDRFRAHDETVRQLRQTDADIRLFHVVKELHGESALEAVTLENTESKTQETVDCDALIVNIGFKSSLGPIKDWGLAIEKNQISVDHHYQTNLPGVFAAGDVCTFDGKLKLIATGVGEAATAVCVAKTLLDPAAKLFPGHSSDMEMPSATS